MVLFEPIPINEYKLTPKHIDVWEFSLSQLPEKAIALLNKEEQIRSQRFYFPRHQRRFTVAHAMLRAILALYLQKNPSDLNFTYNKHGKPQVKNTQDLEFNLSHSKDLGLLAIGQKYPLGVDLEFFSARPYEGIAQHLFSPTEVAEFCTLPKYLKPLGFFHLWAQKEAFIKACGLGLTYPTQTFDVPIMLPANSRVYDTLHQTEWEITSFMPNVACCAAVCVHPDVKHIRYRVINPLTLF